MNANDIDISIISKMTKYNVLETKLINSDTNEFFRSNVVNLFIDLRSIIGKIYVDIDKKGMEEFIFTDQKIWMSSTLVNLIGHYRMFFDKFGFSTRVFLFYSLNVDDTLIKINPDYKKKFIEDRNQSNITELVNTNLELVKTILEYVNNVFIINTENIEERIFPYLAVKRLSKSLLNDNNIILTNDPYYSVYFKYEFGVLTMKGDKSKFFTPIDYCAKNLLVSISSSKKVIKEYAFLNLYPIYISLIGDKKVSIKGIRTYGVSKSLGFIEELVREGILTDTVYTLKMLEDIIKEGKFLKKDEDNNTFLNNFKCIDCETIFRNHSISEVLKIKQQVYNKSNNYYALDDINQLNLKNHPIKTHFLLKKSF